MKHNQTSKSPFYPHVSLLIDVWNDGIDHHHMPNHPHKPWAARFPSCSCWAVRCAVPTGMTTELHPADGGGGAEYSTHSLVSVSRYKWSITRHSDGGEVILAGGSATCCWAAFRHHSDLGAEVEAVACHWGLLVLGISSQKSLHVPPPPLSFNLRLNLDSVWMRSGKRKFQLFLLKDFYDHKKQIQWCFQTFDW